jgi:ribosomal protein S14
MGESLKQKNRREWCKDVGEVIQPQVKDIVDHILERENNIEKAKDKAKKRDKNACQVTGLKSDKINKLQLVAHHLFCRNAYPHLADVEGNIITITSDVHAQFHQSMGGSGKPCTIDDFIRFVQQYYPSNSGVVIWLQQQQQVLGMQTSVDQRKSHVLRLPASRIS